MHPCCLARRNATEYSSYTEAFAPERCTISGMVDRVAPGRSEPSPKSAPPRFQTPCSPTSVTWWGHATVGIHLAGRTVLTDPVLTGGVGHLVRRRGAAPSIAARSPDAVVISHLHSDHTHLPSLALLDRAVPILLPVGAPRRMSGLRRLPNPLVEIAPGDSMSVAGLTVTAVPAEHDGRRWRFGRSSVPAVGYLLEASLPIESVPSSSSVYFAGDTALFDAMSTCVPVCDVALLPVGGWGPTLGDGHMTPHDAAIAAAAVSARWSIPVHYGTLWPRGASRIRPALFHEPGREFLAECSAIGKDAHLLQPGESWTVPPR